MKRTDFLSLCSLAAGSVIIPALMARLIRDKCVLTGEPLNIALHRAKFSTIYAVNDYGDYGDYALHFCDPDAEPPMPIWEEFIERRGVDLDHDNEWFDFLEQYFSWDRSSGDPEPDIPLNEKIDGGALDFYMEWDFEMHESPMAHSYHYLNDPPLYPGDDGIVVDPLGELDFTEGNRPGSNLTTLPCLQHRLNELDEKIHIEIH